MCIRDSIKLLNREIKERKHEIKRIQQGKQHATLSEAQVEDVIDVYKRQTQRHDSVDGGNPQGLRRTECENRSDYEYGRHARQRERKRVLRHQVGREGLYLSLIHI